MNARFPEHPGLFRDLRHAESVKCNPLLSVVVPCANQETGLAAANRRLHRALDGIHMDFEIVYVDDGSTDSTPDILRELQVFDRCVRVVRLSKSFGRPIAIMAGIEHASGDAIVLAGVDGKNPPEVIGEFVRRWREGSDVVFGERTNGDHRATLQSSMEKGLRRLRNRFSDGGISIDTGSIHLVDRKAVDALLALPNRSGFVQGMAGLAGFSRTVVRYAGVPGTAPHLWREGFCIFREGLVALSMVPLRLATCVGFLSSLLSIVGLLAMSFGKFFHSTPKGWMPGLAAALFISGVQLICLGAIGEYIRRLYGESKRHTGYMVREKAGFGPTRSSTAFDVYAGIVSKTN